MRELLKKLQHEREALVLSRHDTWGEDEMGALESEIAHLDMRIAEVRLILMKMGATE